MQPPSGVQWGPAPAPTPPSPGASLARSARCGPPRERGRWRGEPVPCAPGHVMLTHTFSLRDPPAAIPITAPRCVRSKSQTGEIPATARPRSGKAGSQLTPPPEVRSRGLRGNGRRSRVLARVCRPRTPGGVRLSFLLAFIGAFGRKAEPHWARKGTRGLR